jgi:hypothetical protein
MRLEITPEIPRRRDVEIHPPAAERRPDVPESPLTRRLDRLRETAQTKDTRRVAPALPRPGRERLLTPEAPDSRKVEPEQRPRRTRDGVADDIRGLRLRPEEQKLIAEAGRFRVLSVDDVARTIYDGDKRALEADLHFLREKGVLTVDSVAARNDGRWSRQREIEVVSLTKQGEHLAREVGAFPIEQRLYHGMVKPREAEHDTQIYRAYLKEAKKIERAGGANLRVELDFELKAKVYHAVHEARKADPKRDLGEIRREAAEQFELPYIDNHIEIPDARIHYDLLRKDGQEIGQGSRAAFSDIEVVTAAYRPGHMRGKAQAGFRMYASASDRSRLAKVEDEHRTLDWVMDL